jgi:ATP-dependent DNA helicase RecQ
MPSATIDPTSLTALLKEIWGHPQFRDQQGKIVQTIANGGDALVLMPTGGGKSVCYQLPAIARHRAGLGVTLVVSPLIALMHDQTQALEELGVACAFLNSSLTSAQAQQIESDARSDKLVLLYAAPERVNTPRFLNLLESLNARGKLALFAIDEAHCVSQWGHDFRPEYVALSVLHERFANVPRVALTATADAITRADILQRLQLEHAHQFVSSFDRPNIRYTIVDKIDARKQLLNFLKDEHAGDAGIVYCLSRKKVDETAVWLSSVGLTALPYHAGLDAATRRTHQDRFLQEDGIIMCATIAFGMGIDKPDVRFVAHLDLPSNIEGYYQETGRAGRDGAPANAWMAYGLGDVVQRRRMIDENEASEEFKRIQVQKLDALLGLAESATCRRVALLGYFGQASCPCGNCDNCLHPPSTWDATQAAQKALSAIYRTGQRFGAMHVMDVLTGKATDKVKQFGHDRLPTFGVGKELNDTAWRSVLRQLLSRGALAIGEYQSLHLAGEARQILKGDIPIHLRVLEKASPKSKTRAGRAVSGKNGLKSPEHSGEQNAAFSSLSAEAVQRLNALKAWRTETARAHGVPAYVIFHDKVLIELAEQAPDSIEALAEISGIGLRKLQAYGADILVVLRRH